MAALALRPYQEDAADFLYEKDRAMILAPVGAGKTAITLTAMRDMIQDGHVKRWLVIAPKRVATSVWPVEAPKWAPELSLAVAVGSPKARLLAWSSKADVVVTNYDAVQMIPAHTVKGFDGIVFDELTRLKSPRGIRFKTLEKLADHIKIRWGLTGSFTSNGLEDVFGQCKIIDMGLLGRAKGAFMQQYFIAMDAARGQWTPRSGALPKVMNRIKRATFVLDPGDYKDTLPPLHVVPVCTDMPAPHAKHYRTMKAKMVLEYKGQTITAATAAVVSQKLQQLSSGFVYHTDVTPSETPGRMDTTQTPVWMSDHKFDLLADVLDENQHDNTIIVYNYKEELAELKRRYPHTATIDDKDAIERWNAGKIELLLIHPMSAGHGLNLQHGGCKMVFLSLPWSLELYEQTIGRLHRSGQAHAVWVYPLLTRGTIEERIWQRLSEKRDLSDLAMEELR